MSIEIAIIDSGINPSHPHVNGVAGGIGFRLDSTGEVVKDLNFADEIGHGTAIAGVIREKAPDARIYALKIFHEKLRAPSALLFAALDWAIGEKIKLIHLSLGVGREADRPSLSRSCRLAHENGTIIIASAGSPQDAVYPAALETVIGVCANQTCRPGAIIHHPHNPIEFGAHGRPRPLPGLPQEKNFTGSSFAAAHVTAKIAQILKKKPTATPSEAKTLLIKASDPAAL
ncbi:MAG: S8 family serine peptidase [Desulfobacterales bacterium]|nr:S8 family serine peptidase [Desulfobacterales bacterium]